MSLKFNNKYGEEKFIDKPISQKLNCKPRLILTDNLINQIDTAHKVAPHGIEWSGAVIYRILEGSIQKPEDMVIVAEDFFPGDVGSTAYTATDIADKMSEINEKYGIPDSQLEGQMNGTPETIKYWGIIHTHHKLPGGAYFSSTDTTELEGNAFYHDQSMYLSLIASYESWHKWKAKIAIPFITEKPAVTRQHASGFEYEVEEAKTEYVVCVAECSIELEKNEKKFDPFIVEQLEIIEEENEKRKAKVALVKGNTPVKNWPNKANKSSSTAVKGEDKPKVSKEDQLENILSCRKAARHHEAVSFIWQALKELCSKSCQIDISAIEGETSKLKAVLEELEAVAEVGKEQIVTHITKNFNKFWVDYGIPRSGNPRMDKALLINDCIAVLMSFENDRPKVEWMVDALIFVQGDVSAKFGTWLKLCGEEESKNVFVLEGQEDTRVQEVFTDD